MDNFSFKMLKEAIKISIAGASSGVGLDDSSSDEESPSSESVDEETTDWTYDSNYMRFAPDSNYVNSEKVQRMETELSLGETITLVFLLYDNTEYALQTVRALVAQGPKRFSKNKISDWFLQGNKNCYGKLLETLTVIQNYRILKLIGLSKQEADSRFLPFNDATVFLDRVKKMLYLLVDSLQLKEAETLIKSVRQDSCKLFRGKDCAVGCDCDKTKDCDITIGCDPQYTEFHLLFWIDKGYISIGKKTPVCLKNLTKHLPPQKCSPRVRNRLKEIDIMIESIKSEETNQNVSKANIYALTDGDVREQGLMVVINMEHFNKRDTRREFSHLLPQTPLHNREGTKNDERILARTFASLKFKVVVLRDSCHDQLQRELEETVRENFSPEHSMFFLCVLSHGVRGKIYAANSVPVAVADIRNMISGDSLIGRMFVDKPKVLLVSSCQGTRKLYCEDEEETFADNKVENHGVWTGESFDGMEALPQHADVLTCQAVIEGCVAVRCKIKGTLYIQELCRYITEYHREEHFADIVVRVHDDLNGRNIHVTGQRERKKPCVPYNHTDCVIIRMTPVMQSTLRKKLFLTKVK